jgi:hypothetical protein
VAVSVFEPPCLRFQMVELHLGRQRDHVIHRLECNA